MPLIRKEPLAAAAPTSDPFQDLVEGDAEARWAAARRLADLPGGVKALSDALQRETDPRVREAAFTSLSRTATRESVDAIVPHLRSDDAQLRTAALDALRAMPNVAAASLAILLADPDPDVRLLSCEIARSARSGEAADQLCRLLEHEPQANVCAAAVEVLGEIGDATAVPALSRCASRFAADPFLVFASKAVIEQLRSRSAPAE